MSGFEGSYLGAADKISPAAIMECKICWTPYDPAEGDDYRQVEPGTAFRDLPGDWSCPNCSAPKAQFMVLEDPGIRSGGPRPKVGGNCPTADVGFSGGLACQHAGPADGQQDAVGRGGPDFRCGTSARSVS